MVSKVLHRVKERVIVSKDDEGFEKWISRYSIDDVLILKLNELLRFFLVRVVHRVNAVGNNFQDETDVNIGT